VSLKLIGYGMLAGFAVLGMLLLLDQLVHSLREPVTCVDTVSADQVFQVLADARRIAEEAS
jgi:hypothetical protein